MTHAKSAPAALLQAFPRGVGWASGKVGTYGGRPVLVAIILIMVYEVVARYGFNQPTMWALEFAIYGQILLVALSAAHVLREEGHVSIGLVIEQFSERWRAWVTCANSIVGALYCLVLSIQMWKTARWSLQVNTASETMGVPVAPLQFALFAGFVLLTLQFLSRSCLYARSAVDAAPQRRGDTPGSFAVEATEVDRNA